MELSIEDLELCKSIMMQEPGYYLDEEFRYVTYPGIRQFRYAVSNYGNVVCLPKKRLLNPFDRKGYLAVNLVAEESSKTIKVGVHRLVAYEFIDGRDVENGVDIVNHKDSWTYNNHATNLEWCTISQNVKHALNNDKTYFAQRKFNKEDAKKICSLFVEGYSPKEVFTMITGYEISNQDKSTYTTIKNIYNRKNYKNVSKHYEW